MWLVQEAETLIPEVGLQIVCARGLALWRLNFRGFPSFELAAAVQADEWQSFPGKPTNSEPRGPVYVSKEEVAVGDGLKKA